MSSAGDSTPNQTDSPVWFGVETSSFCHDQRLFVKLANKKYYEVRSRREVLEAGATCWTSRVQQKIVDAGSSVYGRKLYRVVSLFKARLQTRKARGASGCCPFEALVVGLAGHPEAPRVSGLESRFTHLDLSSPHYYLSEIYRVYIL